LGLGSLSVGGLSLALWVIGYGISAKSSPHMYCKRTIKFPAPKIVYALGIGMTCPAAAIAIGLQLAF